MFSVTNALRSVFQNRVLTTQQIAVITLARRLNHHLWENKDNTNFTGAIGFVKVGEYDPEPKDFFDDYIEGENAVYFSQKDLTSTSASEELVSRIYRIANKIDTFDGIDISSGVNIADSYPLFQPYKFSQECFESDPASRISGIIAEIEFSEKIVSLPSFKGKLEDRISFVSPDLYSDIYAHFEEKREEFLSLYSDAVHYCNFVLASPESLNEKHFVYIKSLHSEKATATKMLKDFEYCKKMIEKPFPLKK